MDLNPTLFLTFLLALLLVIVAWLQRRGRRQLIEQVQLITVEDVASEQLGNRRDVRVYLPPGYENAPGKRYPVLYINDGQDMEELQLRETLARMWDRGLVEPLIVVAVPTNEDRLQEYGTAVAANAQGLGRKAAEYSQFIVEELMSLVNERFRTHQSPEATAILGASLGGLSAFDIAWNHPDHFGIAGVFSGSFWWRAAAAAAEDETAVTPNELIMHDVVRRSRRLPVLRAWFQAGTLDERDDRDNNGVIDAIQDTLELIEALEQQGYQRGPQLTYHQVEGGRHDYHTWSRVLPHFLLWAFPAH